MTDDFFDEKQTLPFHRSGSKERFEQLLATFPSLQGLPGVVPWDAVELDHWASTDPGVTSGMLHAIRFVLSVWTPSNDWQCGRFDLHAALRAWDPQHLVAFYSWVTDPWWP